MTRNSGRALALACLFSIWYAQSASAQNTANCGDASSKIITSAQFYLSGELSDSLNYIANMRAGGDSSRFMLWFGSTDSTIVDRVQKMVQEVYEGVQAVTYNCDCPRTDWIAYVDPEDATFQIHMCRAYFDNFASGNMNMHVLAHEISHFLGARDCTNPVSNGPCCYGLNNPGGCSSADPIPNTPALAQMLAASDPATASVNAYNIGFFVSNGQ